MSLQFKYTFPLANANLAGFASNVTGASFALTANAPTDGLAHQVSIRNDSITDHSGKTITLVGIGANGQPLTEVVTGPGTSATVESAGFFKSLTSATPSATIGADTFDIGWVDEISRIIMLNHLATVGALVQVNVTGTLNYKFQVTAAERKYIEDGTADWVDTSVTALTNATTSQLAHLEAHLTAARFMVNSYTDGATAAVYTSESGAY